MALTFVNPNEVQKYLKMLIEGPSGSGKSHTSLIIADFFSKLLEIPRKEIMVADSEYGRIIKKPAEMWKDFEYCQLIKPTLEDYRDLLVHAYNNKIKLVIIDSFTHAYKAYVKAGQDNGGTYVSWGKVNNRWDKLMDAINNSPLHVIATARVEEKIEVERMVAQNGKETVSVKKLGLKTDLKKDSGYEFDITMRMGIEAGVHIGTIMKDNNHWGLQNEEFENPGEKLATILCGNIKNV